MKAKNKDNKSDFGFDKQADGRIKLWPINQPMHHEFMTEAEFNARFEVIPEQTKTTP